MDQFDPAPLSPDIQHQLEVLCASLPLPISGSPEDRVRRDNAAIAQIACLRPADVDEANLATVYVAANAQALECLRLAHERPSDESVALKLTAQAASMMRQARAARLLLTRIQAERRKGEEDQASPAEATSAAPAPADITAQAEQYAMRHRKRAALIRSLGRLPDRIDCGPMPQELIREIVTGTSPILRSLDAKAKAA
jgi:hypothetical protein